MFSFLFSFYWFSLLTVLIVNSILLLLSSFRPDRENLRKIRFVGSSQISSKFFINNNTKTSKQHRDLVTISEMILTVRMVTTVQDDKNKNNSMHQPARKAFCVFLIFIIFLFFIFHFSNSRLTQSLTVNSFQFPQINRW
jgi:UDP-N-acetylmuramyl pentapeptide phosphotransferase/UDP-N-acetylglucosamine-1-phosphate transferase